MAKTVTQNKINEQRVLEAYKTESNFTKIAITVGISVAGVIRILQRAGLYSRSSVTYQESIGRRYRRLVVLSYHGKDKWGGALMLCRCDCGTIKTVHLSSLVQSKSLSCGCLQKEQAERQGTHNKSRTRTYRIWLHMRGRCNNPNDDAFKHYGQRGITVCERWLSFENFLADMGECPEGMSIDRIDNNGNYEPGNCRWATATEQARNTRQNVLITFDGQTKTVTEWTKIKGLTRDALDWRIKQGWPIELALNTPVKERRATI